MGLYPEVGCSDLPHASIRLCPSPLCVCGLFGVVLCLVLCFGGVLWFVLCGFCWCLGAVLVLVCLRGSWSVSGFLCCSCGGFAAFTIAFACCSVMSPLTGLRVLPCIVACMVFVAPVCFSGSNCFMVNDSFLCWV